MIRKISTNNDPEEIMLSLNRRALVKGAAVATLVAAHSAQAAAATGSIYIIAEIVAKPEKADDLRKLLVPFAEKARAEPGCQHYDLLEVQNEPGRFLTFEQWADKASIDAHMTTPHIKEIGPKLQPILAKPFTQIFMNLVSS